MPTRAPFDSYAENYDEALNQGLAVTGEGKDYFARGRIHWLASCLSKLGERPGRLMDYGCGDGSSAQFLLEATGAGSLIGVDTSEKSLAVANRAYNSDHAVFLRIEEYQPAAQVDLVYCNGVFHHIPLRARARP